MRYIALFFPAILSVGISYRRNNGEKWLWFDYVREYVGAVICNALVAGFVISYVLGLGAVNIEAFDSFPFFTKYLLIAIVLATLFPHIRDVIKANISISYEIDKKQDKDLKS